jgi:hypothetical protein
LIREVSPRTRRQAATEGQGQSAKAAPKGKGKDDGDPALQGWKARDCKASVKDGILRITSIG